MGASRGAMILMWLTVFVVHLAGSETLQCNENGVHCLPNGVQYQTCVEGVATPPTTDCPANTTCNTTLPSSWTPCSPPPSSPNDTCPPGTRLNETTKTCHNTFACTSVGHFPDPTDCSKYHVCFMGVDGDLNNIDLECEQGSYFQENASKCVKDSTVCPSGLKNPPLLGQAEKNSQTLSVHIDCVDRPGSEKWEDPINCSYFYMCVWKDGHVVPKKYRCLNPSVYDPDNQRCNRSYKCTKPQTANNNDPTPGWSSEFS